MHATDLLIHTRIPLDAMQFEAVAHQVTDLEGVVRCDRSPRRPDLILVAYQADRTRALAILNKFTRLGFHASLVGM